MAKRFLDTNLFRKRWIRELDTDMKLFWVYLLTDCDHAGIWDVDVERASFQLNVNLREVEILETFNKKIVPFKRDKWFVPKFIEYQYGELNDNIRPHQSVIKILEKYKLHKGLINPLKTLKDKDKAKNKETKRNQLLDIKDNLKEYKEIFINKDVGLEFDKWNDYMLSNGKTYKNYSAAFRNWLRNDFDTDSKTIEKNFKKTKTGLFIAYCKKCNKKNYPNDYQLKQSSCCGVDWSPNQTN